MWSLNGLQPIKVCWDLFFAVFFIKLNNTFSLFLLYLQEFLHYGSIPMQSSHMKQNYAAYLSSFFPTVCIPAPYWLLAMAASQLQPNFYRPPPWAKFSRLVLILRNKIYIRYLSHYCSHRGQNLLSWGYFALCNSLWCSHDPSFKISFTHFTAWINTDPTAQTSI